MKFVQGWGRMSERDVSTFHGFIFASLASRSFATIAKMLLNQKYQL